MAFPPGFLDELRSRVSLGELVGRRVRLVRRGGEHSGLCPFHNEKTPSFYVVEDKGFFHCFGCGAHGDAIGFVMRADHLDFIEAVERLAGEAGIAVPAQTPQERERATRQKTQLEALAAAATHYEAQLWSPAGRTARDYLTARGLDEATIRRFRLGWAGDDRQALRRALGSEFPEELLHEAGLRRLPRENGEAGGTPYDYFRSRVMFPIGDRAGRVIAFGARTLGDDQPKYLNSPDTPLFEKGRVLYGWAAARVNLARSGSSDAPTGERGGNAPEVIVVEGYMDVIALHRAGFGAAVAPLGTALTEMQLHELWRLGPEPLLCFDGDTAGERAALRVLDRALPLLQPGRSLRFVTLPRGEDPDSLVRNQGRPLFAEMLASALPLSEKLLREEERKIGALDTPERRAQLEARLMEQVSRIADRSVQSEYRRFLRERLSPAGRPGGERPLGRSPKQKPAGVIYTVLPGVVREHRTRQPAPPPLRSPARLPQEVRLKILLQHPFLIAEALEEIAGFEFPDPELNRLRDAILQAEPTLAGLDAAALRQHFCSAGFARSVNAILSPLVGHAGFLPPDCDPDTVRREWARINSVLADADRDLHAPAREPVDPELPEEAWEQARARIQDRLRVETERSADEFSSRGYDPGA
ncbi:MAG TPA: DNA primase [Stellaceae bacterium]|nr:DNA primase [Stellaceae bacterium]